MNQPMLHKLAPLLTPTSVLVGLLILAAPTRAYYQVIDDDLLPESEIQARSRMYKSPAPPIEEAHYNIPFSRGSTPIVPPTRAALDALIPMMPTAKIRIVGRPDDVYSADNPKLANLANSRAISMRDYLVRHGVASASITVVTDNTPTKRGPYDTYPSDLYITTTPVSSRTTATEPATEQISLPAGQVRTTPNATLSKDSQLIEYINQAVQSGLMKPDVALTLLRTMLTSKPNEQPQPVTTSAVTLPLTVAPSEIKLPTVWTLDKTLTLRENIDAWSKTAGWNQSHWEASNFYQVRTAARVNGNFPEVLRKVADATGLNICAKSQSRFVRVTDPDVLCNND